MKKFLFILCIFLITSALWAFGVIPMVLPTKVHLKLVNTSNVVISDLSLEYCNENFALSELSPGEKVSIKNSGSCFYEGGINFFLMHDGQKTPKGTCLYIDGMKNITATIKLKSFPVKEKFCTSERYSKLWFFN